MLLEAKNDLNIHVENLIIPNFNCVHCFALYFNSQNTRIHKLTLGVEVLI
jgi:hypothetical protein